MKFKLDENFGPTIHEVFRRRDLDCHTIHQEGLAGATDPTVLEAAVAEERVLVTLDKDFANVLIYPPESTCGVVVLNLPGRATRAAGRRPGFVLDCLRQPTAPRQVVDCRDGAHPRAPFPG